MDKQQLQQTQLPIDIYQKTQAASAHQQQRQASYSTYQPTQTMYSAHQQKQNAYDMPQNNLNQTTNIAEHVPPLANQKQNQQQRNKKGVLNDISFVAIVASTLASLTSFVLSSQIGLTGSLIGVGIAAAASALASQVCSSVLTATGEKLKAQQDQQEQARLQQARTQAPAQTPHAAARTQVHNAQHYNLRLAPQSLRLAASQQARKRLILVGALSTLAALACVGIYAAVVMFATHGEGIGSKQIFTPAPQVHNIQDKQGSLPKKDETVAQKRDNVSPKQNKGTSTTQNAQNQQNSDNEGQKDTTDTSTESDTGDQKNTNEPTTTHRKHEGTTQGGTSVSEQEKKDDNANNQPNGTQQKSPTNTNEN